MTHFEFSVLMRIKGSCTTHMWGPGFSQRYGWRLKSSGVLCWYDL